MQDIDVPKLQQELEWFYAKFNQKKVQRAVVPGCLIQTPDSLKKCLCSVALLDTRKTSSPSCTLLHIQKIQLHRVPVIVSEFVKRGANAEELENLNSDLQQQYGADLSCVVERWSVTIKCGCPSLQSGISASEKTF